MKHFRSFRLAFGILMVFACVLALTPAVQAGKKSPVDEVKALKAQLKSAQGELRRLNEEGGAVDQERAQQLMEKISRLRERLAELEEKKS